MIQEVKIIVKETDNVGELVDSILNIGVYKVNSFEWKPFVEADAEGIALDSGLSQAQELCHHINRQMGEILAIEEVFEKDE